MTLAPASQAALHWAGRVPPVCLWAKRWHPSTKLGSCTLSDELRDAHCPTWLRRACEKEAWHPLFSRGVPARAIGQIDFVKVKAHTGWAELLSRAISPRQQFGNWLADLVAKASAKYSESLAPTANFDREVKKAVAWMQHRVRKKRNRVAAHHNDARGSYSRYIVAHNFKV